jgi:hypothetical protein
MFSNYKNAKWFFIKPAIWRDESIDPALLFWIGKDT